MTGVRSRSGPRRRHRGACRWISPGGSALAALLALAQVALVLLEPLVELLGAQVAQAALAGAVVRRGRGRAVAGRLALVAGRLALLVGRALLRRRLLLRRVLTGRERHVDLEGLAVTDDRQLGLVTGGQRPHVRGERLGAAHGLVVDRDDHVA